MPNLELKYFRNIEPIDNIDEDCLWILQNGYFVLVDDDEFITLLASENWEKFKGE